MSITLSDSFCVDRHRESFLDLIRSDIDILFANEKEIKSLYQVKDFDDAMQAVRKDCEIAVLTRSEAGCVIVKGDEVHVVRRIRSTRSSMRPAPAICSRRDFCMASRRASRLAAVRQARRARGGGSHLACRRAGPRSICWRITPAGGTELHLELPQPDAVDDVIGALAQDEIGALAGGQHVLAQIDEVDRLPDAVGGLARLRVGERGIAMEIGRGSRKAVSRKEKKRSTYQSRSTCSSASR